MNVDEGHAEREGPELRQRLQCADDRGSRERALVQAILYPQVEVADMGWEDRNRRNDGGRVRHGSQPRCPLRTESLREAHQVRGPIDIPTIGSRRRRLDAHLAQLREHTLTLRKDELRMLRRVRIDPERPPLRPPCRQNNHQPIDLPLGNAPRHRKRNTKVRARGHLEPELRPVEHVRVVAPDIHVRPHLGRERRPAPRRADVRDDERRGRPPVLDAVAEDLDKQLRGETTREREDAAAALDGRPVLCLVVSQVPDLIQETLDALLYCVYGEFMLEDGLASGLDDFGSGFDAISQSFLVSQERHDPVGEP